MSRLTRLEAAMRRREERYQARHADIVRPASVADDAICRVLQVVPEQAGMRLDRFVQRQLRDTSRTRSQRIIARGAFTNAGRALKKNHRLQAGERVILWRPPLEEVVPDIQLGAVYEDDQLLALNKPPGLAVHPSARHNRATITSMLRVQRPDDHLTLTHRLDRETSGVLLLARTRWADRTVKIQFQKRVGVEKRYLALCLGVPEWQSRRCDLSLEPDPISRYRVKMRVAESGGLISGTTFEVLECRRREGGNFPSDGSGIATTQHYSLLRCTLHSGRQHQIRVHLAALGLPIVGDKLYGPYDDGMFARAVDGELSDEDHANLELPRQALHAAELAIDHPTSGARLHIEAPMFDDMQAFWDALAPAASGPVELLDSP